MYVPEGEGEINTLFEQENKSHRLRELATSNDSTNTALLTGGHDLKVVCTARVELCPLSKEHLAGGIVDGKEWVVGGAVGRQEAVGDGGTRAAGVLSGAQGTC